VEDDEPEPILQEIDPVSVRKQIEGVKAVKNDRDNDTVNTKLSQLETHAKSQKNLMPAIIDCVRAECTLGEIADVLRKQFGEFVQT
jgi:methylmalonyl-CoA mutase N-terminal domain/subunit